MSVRTYQAASRLLGALPEPVVRRSGEALGWLSYSWAKERRQMADRHMERVGGATGRELFTEYGRYWAELLWMDDRKASSIRRHIETEGLHYVEAARDRGKGMIYALPHVGNWEMAGLIAEDLGIRVVAVAEDLPDSEVTRWFVAKREALGLEIVIAQGGLDLLSRLRQRLSEGDAIALLCDRDVTGTGVEVEFFGEPTSLPVGPAMLAIRSGAPILPVASFFRPGRGHHVVVHEPVHVEEEGSLRQRVEATTTNVASALELLIRTAPAQWHLVQPNWPSDRS